MLNNSTYRRPKAFLCADRLIRAGGHVAAEATSGNLKGRGKVWTWFTDDAKAETQNAWGAYLVAEGKRAEGIELLRASLPSLKSRPQATVRRRALQRTQKLLTTSS